MRFHCSISGSVNSYSSSAASTTSKRTSKRFESLTAFSRLFVGTTKMLYQLTQFKSSRYLVHPSSPSTTCQSIAMKFSQPPTSFPLPLVPTPENNPVSQTPKKQKITTTPPSLPPARSLSQPVSFRNNIHTSGLPLFCLGAFFLEKQNDPQTPGYIAAHHPPSLHPIPNKFNDGRSVPYFCSQSPFLIRPGMTWQIT